MKNVIRGLPDHLIDTSTGKVAYDSVLWRSVSWRNVLWRN